jgi:hypothetical protein
MGYRFDITPEGLSEPILEGEPDYCQVLPRAPASREPELDEGWWLILLYASGSGTDHLAIPVALAVVKEFAGRVRLGLRKFSGHEEMQTWCPAVREQRQSPLWLVLHNGILKAEWTGRRPQRELCTMLQQLLSARYTVEGGHYTIEEQAP